MNICRKTFCNDCYVMSISMIFLWAVLGSHGIVAKCKAAIFFSYGGEHSSMRIYNFFIDRLIPLSCRLNKL